MKCGGICGDSGSALYCNNYGNIDGEAMYYQVYTSDGENCRVGGIIGDAYNEVYYCVNYGNVMGKDKDGSGCVVGGIAGRKTLYNNTGIKYCYNLGNITSTGGAGRICAYASEMEECYSLETATVNGFVSTENIGTSLINGASLNAEQLEAAINGNYAGNDKVLSTNPANGETQVNPKLYGSGYDIIVCFEDIVTKGTGCIKIINIETGQITEYDVETNSNVLVDENVLTISNVQLPYGTDISVIFENGCVHVGDKPFYGFSEMDSWTFTTKMNSAVIESIKLGEDTYKFINSSSDMGVANGSPYPINRFNWFKTLNEMGFSLEDIAAIFANTKRGWSGSCYGMSSVFIQNY